MIIATAGHVDHGKTSLVKSLTGIDTDRLAEEQARGLTINLGFAYTQSATGQRLGFVDVPGHIRFIGNMLAGVAGIDMALLVVAADDGVMPQTVEHLHLLNLLGVRLGLVALTKTDRVNPTRIAEVSQALEQLLANTRLAGADIIPVSATTGDGIDRLRQALNLAAENYQRRSPEGLFRLAIDRSFNVKGAGLVVTGSVFAGQVNSGDELLLAPQGMPVRVRSLRTQNEAAESAQAGDRAALN
ncbi:MAG: selenocysteine-specific translation elongation factor, partial [Pseudomonadales bacterium]